MKLISNGIRGITDLYPKCTFKLIQIGSKRKLNAEDIFKN